MDPIIFQYIREIFRQFRLKLPILAGAATVISFLVLIVGMLQQPKYETAITIYADQTNVIKPLLEGQASVTVPKSERLRIVQEIMFSPRLLEKVITSSIDESVTSGSDRMEELMTELRRNVAITGPASDYINIAYSHTNPDTSYRVANKLTNLFIEESAQTKRSESKSAFTFIDEQVKSYKAQLVEAENKLKAFEASNIDGAESQVNASITRLQAMIDETSIDIEAGQVRIAALESQITSESRYVTSDYSARVYRERLAQLESRLDTMLLNYREEHPDVVDVKLQIQDVKRTIVDVENSAGSGEAEDLTGQRLNPIYEQLSNQLAEAKVTVQTMRHRLTANQKRLEDQYERRRRVASNQAELSELTRDYDVTKTIYEDLLERKERARISMTLDLAGQGVTYKVLEPAVFPMTPTGIGFVHFAAAGPVVGLFFPFAFLVGWVFLDHRVKFEEQLEELYPGVVLAVLPPDERRRLPWKAVTIGVAGAVVAYAGSAFAYQLI